MKNNILEILNAVKNIETRYDDEYSLNKCFLYCLDRDKILLLYKYRFLIRDDVLLPAGQPPKPQPPSILLHLAESLYYLKYFLECNEILEMVYDDIKKSPLNIVAKSNHLKKIINLYYHMNSSKELEDILKYCINESIYYADEYYNNVLNSEPTQALFEYTYHLDRKQNVIEEKNSFNYPFVEFLCICTRLSNQSTSRSIINNIPSSFISKSIKKYLIHLVDNGQQDELLSYIQEHFKIHVKVDTLVTEKEIPYNNKFEYQSSQHDCLSHLTAFPNPFDNKDKMSLKKIQENDKYAGGSFGGHKRSGGPFRGKLKQLVAISYIDNGYFKEALQIIGYQYTENDHTYHPDINNAYCMQYLANSFCEQFSDISFSDYFENYKSLLLEIEQIYKGEVIDKAKLKKSLNNLFSDQCLFYMNESNPISDNSFETESKQLSKFKFCSDADWLNQCKSIDHLDVTFKIINKLSLNESAKIEILLEIIERMHRLDTSHDINKYYDELLNDYYEKRSRFKKVFTDSALQTEIARKKYDKTDAGYEELCELQHEQDELIDDVPNHNIVFMIIISLLKTGTIKRFDNAMDNVVWNREDYDGTIETEWLSHANDKDFTISQALEIIHLFELHKKKEKKQMFYLRLLSSFRSMSSSYCEISATEGIGLNITTYELIKTLFQGLFRDFSINDKFNIELRYVTRSVFHKKEDVVLNNISMAMTIMKYKTKDSYSYPNTGTLYSNLGDYYYNSLLLDIIEYAKNNNQPMYILGDNTHAYDIKDDISYIKSSNNYIPSEYHRRIIQTKMEEIGI